MMYYLSPSLLSLPTDEKCVYPSPLHVEFFSKTTYQVVIAYWRLLIPILIYSNKFASIFGFTTKSRLIPSVGVHQELI